MTVSAVMPADAASDPKHPDHDRWVKDTTLAMEVEHAKRVGLPLRVAEAENQRMLDRSERIARESKPAAPKAKRVERQQRINERGVTAKVAAPEVSILKLSPCGRCGTCRNCMRERRVLLIVQKRKTDDVLGALAARMFMSALHADARVGRYAMLTKRDVARALTADAEAVCDASIRLLGEWR